ncbi:ABC transporter substrate-binding protein [Dongshaea marina]|uniref:ABC transporter substrate-binding protein n=1 Tax=Dongshaea marina TaxID=2047966 RepID=UPI000D3E9222|nr:ABC transporter substrate-binding protein [Dongshaea marina]
MSKGWRVASIVLLTALLVVGSGFGIYLMTRPAQVKIRLGLALQPASALVMIALERGFFEKRGLQPVVSSYPSGKRALREGLLTGQADVVTTADVPFVAAVLEQFPLVAVGSIYYAYNMNRIVARRDLGVNQVADLRGKRVGTQKYSAVHYFWHLFQQQHQLQAEEQQTRFYRAEQLVNKLQAGDIDAFSMREPYVSEAIRRMPDRIRVFSSPGTYLQSELVVVKRSYSRDSPEIMQRLMEALMDAERYSKRHPEKASEIVARALGISGANPMFLNPEVRFEVEFSQRLLESLSAQALWMRGGDSKGNGVYLMDAIDVSHLSLLDSEKVSIIW